MGLYWLVLVVASAGLGYCMKMVGGIEGMKNPLGKDRPDSPEVQLRFAYQNAAIYCSIFLLYLGLLLISTWMSDMLFVCGITVDMAWPLLIQVPRNGLIAIAVAGAFATWLIQDYWFYIYIGCYGFFLVLLFATLLGVFLVQMFLSEQETENASKVREHRILCRKLKEQSTLGAPANRFPPPGPGSARNKR